MFYPPLELGRLVLVALDPGEAQVPDSAPRNVHCLLDRSTFDRLGCWLEVYRGLGVIAMSVHRAHAVRQPRLVVHAGGGSVATAGAAAGGGSVATADCADFCSRLCNGQYSR